MQATKAIGDKYEHSVKDQTTRNILTAASFPLTMFKANPKLFLFEENNIHLIFNQSTRSPKKRIPSENSELSEDSEPTSSKVKLKMTRETLEVRSDKRFNLIDF